MGQRQLGPAAQGVCPGGRAHRPRPVQPWVRWGVSRAGPVWPGARDPRLEARPAGGRRGAPRQARPRARSPGRREIRAQTCGLHVSRGRTHGRGMGEARQAPLPLGRKRGRCASFPAGAGARLPRGRAARPPRLARCLFVSRRLPSSQTHGCWQEIGRARGSGRRRRGGEGAPRGRSAPGAPSPAGAEGDVLTSRLGKQSAFHSWLGSLQS